MALLDRDLEVLLGGAAHVAQALLLGPAVAPAEAGDDIARDLDLDRHNRPTASKETLLSMRGPMKLVVLSIHAFEWTPSKVRLVCLAM